MTASQHFTPEILFHSNLLFTVTWSLSPFLQKYQSKIAAGLPTTHCPGREDITFSPILPQEPTCEIHPPIPTAITYLRVICVVKHPKNNPWHRVYRIFSVRWGREGRQIVLQCLTEHAVKSQVGPQDVPLLPTVFFQFLNLRPEAV